MNVDDVKPGRPISATIENAVRSIIRREFTGSGLIDTGDGFTAIPGGRGGTSIKFVITRAVNIKDNLLTVQEVTHGDTALEAKTLGSEFDALPIPGRAASSFNNNVVVRPFQEGEVLHQGIAATSFVVLMAMKIHGQWYVNYMMNAPPNAVALDWQNEQAPGSS